MSPDRQRAKTAPANGVNNHAEARATAHRVAPVVDPNCILTIDQARHVLGLAKGCLPREVRLGRLRVSRRAGRHFVLGRWLLEWIEGGELRRDKRTAGEDGKGGAQP
jgi:hypothetical protein